MTKEFVQYNEALELKELGFDEPCFGWFKNTKFTTSFNDLYPRERGEIVDILKAPLYQQAFRWFREKYDLRIWIESNYGVLKFEYVIATTNPNFIDKQFNDLSVYKTYEEAELACLQKLIQIVKDNIEIEVDSYDYKEATQITEKIAIEFAEWIRIKDFQPDSLIKSNIVGGLGVWSGESYFTSKDNWIGLDMKYYTSEELFQEFIKQRQ